MRPGRDDIQVLFTLGAGTAMTRLYLLHTDLQSIRFALDDFEQARERIRHPAPGFVGVDPVAMARMFHHAKTFVCAVRRFSRLLEAARTKRSEYPHNVAAVLALQWRANRAFLESYSDPRNAIEHIDGEVTGTNHRFLNLANDYLEVVAGTGVSVSRDVTKIADSIWRAILVQVERAADAKNPRGTIHAFLRLLKLRAHSIPSEART